MIRRAAPSLGVVVAVTFALGACAQPSTDPTAWQQSVQTVAEQASAGDYASALAGLDALESDVTARRDAGEITAVEADAILTRIATVRADLTALTPAPSPTPTESSEPTETTEPEPSETAEPEPTATAEPTPDDPQDGGGEGEETPSNGNGNKGPGGGGPGAKDDKAPGDRASPDPGKKDG